ncbi:MAG: response regulator transcription factor [Anaerolineales bacterium]
MEHIFMVGELILLVDDEPNILQLARMYLEREGFQVESVGDGEAALEAVRRLQPGLMVLDLMLPQVGGLEVCKRLRSEQNPIPILMLTAKDEDVDKIIGLELGADDYLTKPFNPREMVARVKAILRRRRRGREDSRGAEKPIHLGDLVIDPQRYEVRIGSRSISLRNQEFDLLYTLARHHGMVLSREQILENAWGYVYAGQTRTVDVHIGQLRKKIADSRLSIVTVIGVGYKLVVE